MITDTHVGGACDTFRDNYADDDGDIYIVIIIELMKTIVAVTVTSDFCIDGKGWWVLLLTMRGVVSIKV